MAMTPRSSSSSLLPVSEFLKRADLRVVGDLCGDAGVRIAAGALPTDPNLLACLDDAQGEMEAYVSAGQRYTPDDLAALTGTGRARLWRLLTEMTVLMLYDRRTDYGSPPKEKVEYVSQKLSDLQNGQTVFGLVEAQRAGTADHELQTGQQTIERGGLVIDAERYFGQRSDRNNPYHP